MRNREYPLIEKVLRLLTVVLICIAVSVSPTLAAAISDTPETSLKTPKLVPEESVSTYVPSEAAPGQGIAVNIIYPEKPRYNDGAPVAVVAPGGNIADGLSFTMHASQVGFVEVRMAFPGGGKGKLQSTGIYDNRGSQSQQAFKDVILFAAGQIADTQGRHIADLVPVKVAKTNVGIVAWSNGGNVALITLSKYAGELKPIVSWIAFYESPIGPLFFPPNLGGNKDLLLNHHYRQGSCATGDCNVDWRKLKWDYTATRDPGEHKKLGEPEIPGVLYFDENKNGKWDESVEYALTYCLDVGLDKQIYPPDVTHALERLGLFDAWVDASAPAPKTGAAKDPHDHSHNAKAPDKEKAETPKSKPDKKSKSDQKSQADPKAAAAATTPKKVRHVTRWPASLANLRESEAYFQERDGSLHISNVANQYPELLIVVFASQIDHLQRQPDHPHIALQYNAWLANKAHWVRLNPEAIYPASITNMNVGNFTNNRPNAPIDASTISNYLEPEGSTKDYVMMEAAIAEVADRRRSKNLGSPLPATLLPYFNSANPPPPPTPPTIDN